MTETFRGAILAVPRGQVEAAYAYGMSRVQMFCRVLLPQMVRYIVYQEGQFRLVSTFDEFRALYAPIESADEALSYALATTGLSARYNLKVEAMRCTAW